MGKLYYLIDFENVQPKALDRLKVGESRIKVFLGQQQTKLMLDLVQALQPFGADAEYITISGSGPDAVDFHIAFYIGQISAAEPGSTFRIISKDKGFDPLVRHLNARSITCQRLAEIPGDGTRSLSGPAKPLAKTAKKAAAKKTPAKNVVVTVEPKPRAVTTPQPLATAAQVKVVLACLVKSTKPSKVSGLRSSIKSWFKPPLDDKIVDAVLQSLQASKTISISGAKVAYSLS